MLIYIIYKHLVITSHLLLYVECFFEEFTHIQFFKKNIYYLNRKNSFLSVYKVAFYFNIYTTNPL